MTDRTHIPLTTLETEQLEYLDRARRARECSVRMMYVPLVDLTRRGAPVAVVGAFLVALTATLLAAGWIGDTGGSGSVALQATVIGVAFAVTMTLLLAITRNILEPDLGHFLLVDPSRLWIVSGARVRIIRRRGIRDARCVHGAQPDGAARSALVLETDSDNVYLNIGESGLAEFAARAIESWRDARSA